MRRALLMLAACSPHGVVLEIVPPDATTVTQVELFVGNVEAPCGRGCMVTPPDLVDPTRPSTRALAGQTWLQKAPLLDRVDVVDGVARILVEADGGSDERIPRLLAVGFDGDTPN